MLDPLDWDPDPQAESAEPPVSTSHKSTRLCRIANWEFIFSSFVFLPLCEDRFCTLVRRTQKSRPLSQPWSTITVSLPSECLLTAGQRASQTASVSWCRQCGGSSCQIKPTVCKLNPVAYSQVYSVQCSFATISQPAEPPNWPRGSTTPGSFLVNHRQEANLNKTVCVAIVFHVRYEPCLYITVFYPSKSRLLLLVFLFIIYVSCVALNLYQLYSDLLCSSPCLHPFVDLSSLCRSVLLTLMGLDAIHDWDCQHLDEGQLKKGECVFKYVSICVHLGTDCYLFICVHATLPTLQVAHSWGALATNIQPHQRNYVRQQSLCIPRTEQMERAIQWIKHNERSNAISGVKGWSKNGENNICQGFVQGWPLRWWT